jgi:ectoine hydroxylase-related dioxygenase (phytanoyl-CoA dioxygenase family)
LDVYGYVVIENVLTPAEVEQLRDDIYDIEQRFRSGDDLGSLRPAFLESEREDNFRVVNLPHLGPSFFDYLTHPRIVGMAEEVMPGGPARLLHSDAHIRRAPADPAVRNVFHGYGFHHGGSIEGGALDGTIANGLYHFPEVVALTNLTDLGQDDGGTMVIPGTHKIPGELKARYLDSEHPLIAATKENPSLIHHVEAPAGSTLLFFESLIHASGDIRSGRDRVLVMGAYRPYNYAAELGYEPAAELVRRLPEEYQPLFTGWYNSYPEIITARSLTDNPPA